MQKTWEKIVHHVGTIYGHEIRNELHKKMKVLISNTEYTENLQLKHKQHGKLLNLQSARLSEAR